MTQPDGQRATVTRIATGPSTVVVSWGTSTHTGKLRRVNEDAVLAAPPVFVVADGMGGHAGGDVASSLAIEAMGALAQLRAVDAREVRAAVMRANAAIVARAEGDDRVMGTTLSGLVAGHSVAGDEVLVLNIGDSRTYRRREGRLEQLTVDHSHVQELIDAGLLDPAAAAVHPERNVVTRALGVETSVDIDLRSVHVRSGDRFLICSDGLSSELSDEAIASQIGATDAQGAADALVAHVLTGRAADNVSVVVVDVVAVEPASCDDDRTDPRPKRSTRHDRTDSRAATTRPHGERPAAPDLSGDISSVTGVLIDVVPAGSAPTADGGALPPAFAELIDVVPTLADEPEEADDDG